MKIDEKITRNETFFHRGESIVKSPEKIFPENSLENSINLLIYGFKVKKMFKNKYSHFCQFFIDPTDLKTLNWLSEKKSYEKSRIKLSKILIISENNYQKKYKQDRYDCLYIYYIKMDNIKKNLVLKFETLLERDLFWQGLLYFIREERIINENK